MSALRRFGRTEAARLPVSYQVYTDGLEDPTLIADAALPTSFQFGAGKCCAVTIRPLRPITLHCRAGALWVTRHDDPNDYILDRNTALTVSGKESLCIVATRASPSAVLDVE